MPKSLHYVSWTNWPVHAQGMPKPVELTTLLGIGVPEVAKSSYGAT
jgi:hypothetical protein